MNLNDTENFFKIKYLLSKDGIGQTRIIALLKNFDYNLDKLFNASLQELQKVHNLSKKLATGLFDFIQNYRPLDESKRELEILNRYNATVLTILNDKYPKKLKEIFLPPVILYLLGNNDIMVSPSIAIVGTRRPSGYGRYITEYFTKELVLNGLVTVSGLARGIDTISHRTTLITGGKTIAVIGSGLDVIYPAENKGLFKTISEEGLIISEYAPGTKPDAQNFPRRNRIISGLSLGTLIIESGMKGGALHTAAYALEQGKEVFAVPGNINSQRSEGTNFLIKKGEAKLVQYPKDILEELNLSGSNEIKIPNMQLNLFEEIIYKNLSGNPLHIDELSKITQITPIELNNHLLIMELNGLVKQLPGKYFIRV